MSSLVKAVMRFAPLKSVASPLRVSLASSTRPFTRSLWHMCSIRDDASSPLSSLKISSPSNLCGCGCGSRQVHTKGERELIEFLNDEITAESKNSKFKTVPSEIDGFKVETDGADVVLTRTIKDETIEIHFNINHTVDSGEEPDIDPSMEKPELGDLKSRPTFDVDIKRGNTTLSFTCSFFEAQPPQTGEGYNDIFGIDEISLFDGEWDDNHYAVSGEILDGCLYDLLMNLLDEKGITNEFVEKLSSFATQYENHLYINLLKNIQKFTSKE